MPNLLRQPPNDLLVAASVLSADFGRMGEDCRGILGLDAPQPDAGHADLLHLDVMDGHFVPNLTMGPDLCRGVRRACPDTTLDVHLMISHPEQFFVPFAEAGADHVTFHYEAGPEQTDRAAALARDRAAEAHELGMTAGLAINPATPAERALELADSFEMILVMSIQPGFSGQPFREEMLRKGWMLRRELPATTRLEIDGGVSPANANRCIDSGFDVLVSASAIFGKTSWHERHEVVRGLRGVQNTNSVESPSA